MFNSVYKPCNSNDVNVRRDIGSGELHAKLLDSPPDRSHVAPLVALVAQPVVPMVAKSVARHGGCRRRDLLP